MKINSTFEYRQNNLLEFCRTIFCLQLPSLNTSLVAAILAPVGRRLFSLTQL